jgi:predicted metal-dependent phosphoesterase TrpH
MEVDQFIMPSGMEFKIDAHIHSIYSQPFGGSYLKNSGPKLLFERALARKLNGIAITDIKEDLFFNKVIHFPEEYSPLKLVDFNDEIAKVANQRGDCLYVIRGMEHHDDKGHLLAIGGEKRIKYNPNWSLFDRIKEARDNNRLIGVAHPFDARFGGVGREVLEKIADKIDFIEIFNSLVDKKFNDMAFAAASRYNIPGLSNSDDHNAKPGKSYTVIELNLGEYRNIGRVARKIKDSIRHGMVIDYHQEYTPFMEKVWLFGIRELLDGNFDVVGARFKKYLKSKLLLK